MNKRIPILLGFLLIIFAVWLQVTSNLIVRHWLVALEDISYDFQLRARFLAHHNKKAFTTSVVIVDVDDKSLHEVGHWPWPRSKLAELLEHIQDGGAVVVAFDILFPEKEANVTDVILDAIHKNNLEPSNQLDPVLKKLQPYFDTDAVFAASLKKSDTVLGMTFTPRNTDLGLLPQPVVTLATPAEKQLSFIVTAGVLSNISILQQAAKSSGFLNVFADNDGIVRRAPLLLRYQDKLYPSLALEAARIYLLSKITLVTATYDTFPRIEGIKLGDRIIPTDDKTQVIIPYQGRGYTFPYISAVDVLNNKIAANTFVGKLVFIGTSATGLGDIKPTAIQSIFPGVEIQATIADGLLKNDFSYSPDWALGAELILTIILGGICALVFPYFGPRTVTPLIILIPMALIFANNWAWEKTGFIISILIPMLLTLMLGMLNLIYGYFFETRRRERLKEMFGQYVPEKHIDEMLQSSGSYALHGEDREMTVLFADIRNFTTISEKLSASQLKEMLNEIFTPLTETIFHYRGTIDKYIGDLIMAFWGAPLKDKRHAQHALATALGMQKKLVEIRAIAESKQWPEIYMGIGVNSGIMSVGDMGSKFRRNYTVIGDAVNLGSRVEGLTKHYGVYIIASETTQKNQPKFLFRQLDKVRVKGKKDGVSIYEVVCLMSEATPQLKKEIETSDTALNFYFQQQWNQAKEIFSQLHLANPESKLYQIYLERITEFEKNPPASDWDGIFTHTSK